MLYSKKKVYLIGEIGINHNGDVKLAKKLILMAKQCGFDAVKFQKRSPDICVPESKKFLLRETPWGQITYLEYKKKIELNKKDFDQINEYCKKLKIDWFCSSWDIESLKFLRIYRCKFNKVASAMLTNLELLKHIARERKTTFISTGMSTYKNIDKAIEIFKKINVNSYLCIVFLHIHVLKINLI
jgi:N-acetylneuraminate synthase